MKPALAIVLCLSVVAAPLTMRHAMTPAPAKAAATRIDPAAVAQSIVVVKGKDGHGSGVVVRCTPRDGKFILTVLTCAHVADMRENGPLTILDRPAHFVSRHPTMDAAAFQVDVDAPVRAQSNIRWTQGSFAEEVYGFGYSAWSGREGKLWLTRSILSDYDRGCVAIPGDSGGAVVDSSGALLGLISAVDVVHGTLVGHHGYFVAMTDLRLWLDCVFYSTR